MKKKSLFIIFAMVICGWASWSGALGVVIEKAEGLEYQEVLKIEKFSEGVEATCGYLRNKSAPAIKWLDGLFADLGGPVWVQKCKDEPVVFGLMFIFCGVSACSIFFIVHLLRSDLRFS